MSATTPFTLLIAALGGEGGGVLNDWIVECALAQGLPVQATSVPGVAQRTGSTSYYVEMMRTPAADAAQPVFALSPMPGGVDVVLASELVEAGRAIERGFVHPQRTTLIAASHRVYTTQEKMRMGDGRFDDERIHAGARALAARYLSLDMASIATAHGTVISAVMFGALAGTGLLPWPREVCERVIRDGGVGVQASLAGFGAAFDAVATGAARQALAGAGAGLAPKTSPEIWAPLLATLWPSSARERGPRRGARARLPGCRLRPAVRRTPAAACRGGRRRRGAAGNRPRPVRGGASPGAVDELRGCDPGGRPEVAAQPRRAHPQRIARTGRRNSRGGRIPEAGGRRGGRDPAARARRALARDWATARHGRLETLNRGMHLPSTRIHGYLMLRLLARLRPWRRRALRFHEEQQAIERWLAALVRLLPAAPDFAAALAELPRVLKGYGDTQRRGRASFARIFDTLVERALKPDAVPGADAALTLRSAIDAALAEPEGRDLERSLETAGVTPLPPATRPIVWMKKPRGSTPTVVTSR